MKYLIKWELTYSLGNILCWNLVGYIRDLNNFFYPQNHPKHILKERFYTDLGSEKSVFCELTEVAGSLCLNNVICSITLKMTQ
jgi:hypothetical protein